jgi:hypothetical protein
MLKSGYLGAQQAFREILMAEMYESVKNVAQKLGYQRKGGFFTNIFDVT